MNRMARTDDIPQLVKLRALMQCDAHSIDFEKVTEKFLEATSSYFQEAMSNQTYHSAVAEVDGVIVSANGLIIYRKPPSLDSHNGLVGYVSNVYTLPEHRGKGLASQLMELLITHSKSLSLSKLHLGTTEDGKGIYQRVGFNKVKFDAMELKL